MITEDFYDLIDAELEALIDKYQNDAQIKKHQHSKNHQKAYALLIWFLHFYGKTRNYLPYITEDDSSCDIVFDKTDTQGKKIFYVVQAKWNNKRNCHKEIDSKDIKYALNDFDTILRGDLKVTRYTNSQNPMSDRDFYANDEIQERLQNEFFNTPFWYERRRDEFRVIPDKITRVPNTVFANAYLAYHLQKPVSVIRNYKQTLETGNDLIFLSYKEHKDGLYEQVFNEKTTCEDMLCSYYLYKILLMDRNITVEKSFMGDIFHVLAWFKGLFTKYALRKYGSGINPNKLIIKWHDQNEIIIKIFRLISNQVPAEFDWDAWESLREFFEKQALRVEYF
jgi:hypothetical protein